MTRAEVSFPCAPVGVRDARRFLRSFLSAHQRDELSEAAELALSEVATNAVLHAHTPFDVMLSLEEDGALRVEVADGEPRLPRQHGFADQATTGRGMALLESVTVDCGVRPRRDGKTVWFVVRPPAADADADGASQARWEVDAAADGGGEETRLTVQLAGLPVALWLAAGEHHDSLLRELALFCFEHPELGPAADRLALADRARARVFEHVRAELDRLSVSGRTGQRIRPSGSLTAAADLPATLDLELVLPDDAAHAFAALQDALDAAEELAAAGKLLARPGLPEVIAVRDWAFEQVIAQVKGVAAARWPGSEQERFTVEVRDHVHSSGPAWDAAVVADSDRRVVAVDDTNRIVAVSRPLGEALGWQPGDLVGRRVVALIPPELREAHVAGFTRHLTTGQSHVLGVPLRLPVLRHDGSQVECDLLIERVPGTTGRAVYVAAITPLGEAAGPGMRYNDV